MAAPDELNYARAVERIGRFMGAIAVIGTAAAFSARGWKWGAGFLVGSLISGLNFRWLRKLVESLGPESATRAKRWSRKTAVLSARYLLVALGAYAILRYSPISLTAVIIGLFVLIGAVFVEAAFEILYARKRTVDHQDS